MQRRKFSHEFKLEAVKLVRDCAKRDSFKAVYYQIKTAG
jgi:transposase-like protein